MLAVALLALFLAASCFCCRMRRGTSVLPLLASSIPLAIVSALLGLMQTLVDPNSDSERWLYLHISCGVIAVLAIAVDKNYCFDVLLSAFGAGGPGVRNKAGPRSFFEVHQRLFDGVFRAGMFLFRGANA